MTADPLVEALARTILRHQLGCGQPAEPPAWMVAAAIELATALAVSCRKDLSVHNTTTTTRCVCVRLARELNRRHQ